MAVHLSRMGHATTLVPRRYKHALQLSSARVNNDYLPGVEFPGDLQIGKFETISNGVIMLSLHVHHMLLGDMSKWILWNASSWKLMRNCVVQGLEPKESFAHEVMSQEMGNESRGLPYAHHVLDVALGKPGAMSLR